jgi:murein DD-endopeptidase MepM/ murein hydrolase activator NlpD
VQHEAGADSLSIRLDRDYLGHPYPRAPYHEGFDIADPVDEQILAVAEGMVLRVGEKAGDNRSGIGVLTREFNFGRLIRYCDLSAHTLTPGQKVERGEVIGYLGLVFGLGRAHLEELGRRAMWVQPAELSTCIIQ